MKIYIEINLMTTRYFPLIAPQKTQIPSLFSMFDFKLKIFRTIFIRNNDDNEANPNIILDIINIKSTCSVGERLQGYSPSPPYSLIMKLETFLHPTKVNFKVKLTHDVAVKIFSIALLISEATNQLELDTAFWIT